MQELGVSVSTCLPEWQGVINLLTDACDKKDARAIKELSELVHHHFVLNFHAMNEENLAKILHDYYQICLKAFKAGELGILVDLLWVDYRDLFDVQEAFDNGRQDLVIDWFVDKFNFEKQARTDIFSSNEVQTLKQRLIHELDGSPRRALAKIKKDLIDAFEKKDMRQFWLIESEMDLLIRDAYISKDTRLFKAVFDFQFEFVMNLYQQQQFDLLAEYLNLSQDQFTHFLLLLKHNELGLAKLNIMTGLGYDDLFDTCVVEDVECSADAALDHFNFRNKILSSSHFLPMSVALLEKEIATLIEQEPINKDKLVILDMHLKVAINRAIEENNVNLLDTLIHLVATLYLSAIKSARFESILKLLPNNNVLRSVMIFGLRNPMDRRNSQRIYQSLYACIMIDYRDNLRQFRMEKYLTDFENKYPLKSGGIRPRRKNLGERKNPIAILTNIKHVDKETLAEAVNFDDLENLRQALETAITKGSIPLLLAIRNSINDYLLDLMQNETDKPENAKRYAEVLDVMLQVCPVVIEQNAPEIIDIFSNFLPWELDTIIEIYRHKDVDLLRWLLIYDKKIVYSMKDKSKSPNETIAFLQRVVNHLTFHAKRWSPDFTTVTQSLTAALAENDYTKIHYILNQLECCLIAAMQKQDTGKLKSIVALLRTIIIDHPVIAHSVYAKFYGYLGADLSHIRENAVASESDMIDWLSLNNPRVDTCLMINGVTREEIYRAKSRAYTQPSIDTLLKQTRDAIANDDLTQLDICNERFDQFMISCYLSHNVEDCARALSELSALFKFANENESLAMAIRSEHMQPYEFEIIQFLLNMKEDGLALYFYVSSLQWNDHSANFGISAVQIAEFKRAVFQLLQEKYDFDMMLDEKPKYSLLDYLDTNALRIQHLKIKVRLHFSSESINPI